MGRGIGVKGRGVLKGLLVGRRGKGLIWGVWVEGVGRWETGMGFDFESFSLESYLGI